jgi:hypothetical protein
MPMRWVTGLSLLEVGVGGSSIYSALDDAASRNLGLRSELRLLLLHLAAEPATRAMYVCVARVAGSASTHMPMSADVMYPCDVLPRSTHMPHLTAGRVCYPCASNPRP